MSSSPAPTLSALPPALLLSREAFLATNPHIHALLAGAIVFRPAPGSSSASSRPPRVLLLRRAASDSWPLLWETPGGSVDPSDDSVALAAARELHEETGPRARRILGAVGPTAEDLARAGDGSGSKHGPPGAWQLDRVSGLPVFVETGRLWARATVVVDCEDGAVVLQPEEHAEAAWLTEDEVRGGWIAGDAGESDKRPLEMVSEGVRQTVLAAFRLYKDMAGSREETS